MTLHQPPDSPEADQISLQELQRRRSRSSSFQNNEEGGGGGGGGGDGRELAPSMSSLSSSTHMAGVESSSGDQSTATGHRPGGRTISPTWTATRSTSSLAPQQRQQTLQPSQGPRSPSFSPSGRRNLSVHWKRLSGQYESLGASNNRDFTNVSSAGDGNTSQEVSPSRGVQHDSELDSSEVFDDEGGMAQLNLPEMRHHLRNALSPSDEGGGWLPQRTASHTYSRSESRSQSMSPYLQRQHQRSQTVVLPPMQEVQGRSPTIPVITMTSPPPDPTASVHERYHRHPSEDSLRDDIDPSWDDEFDDSDTAKLSSNSVPMAGIMRDPFADPKDAKQKNLMSPSVIDRQSSRPKLRVDSSVAFARDLERGKSVDRRSPSGTSSGHDVGHSAGGALLAATQGTVSRMSFAISKASNRVVNISNEKSNIRSPFDTTSPLDEEPENPFEDPNTELAAKQSLLSQQVVEETPISDELRGESLKLFGPKNYIRNALCELLLHPATEPVIFTIILLQTILLAAQGWGNIDLIPFENRHQEDWMEWTIFAIFVIYTFEVIARIIVSGFIINPPPPTPPEVRKQDDRTVKDLFDHTADHAVLSKATKHFEELKRRHKAQLANRAFLRHSFNRLDFIAVVSYWINFILLLTNVLAREHIGIFSMLSCLRIYRLLGITSGTSTILRSLKKAAPMLINVAFFVIFFLILFSIIGLQAFQSSLRRHCMWIDPLGIQPNYTRMQQFCGGYTENATGNILTYLTADGLPSAEDPKGFICPNQSICIESVNPYNNTVSFDNIAQSMEMVFIILSVNTFSNIMYNMMDAEYVVSCLFFIASLIVMSFWLVNLVIAVVTTSFQVIREENQKSAFADNALRGQSRAQIIPNYPSSLYRQIYDHSYLLWIALIIIDLIIQAFRTNSMTSSQAEILCKSSSLTFKYCL